MYVQQFIGNINCLLEFLCAFSQIPTVEVICLDLPIGLPSRVRFILSVHNYQHDNIAISGVLPIVLMVVNRQHNDSAGNTLHFRKRKYSVLFDNLEIPLTALHCGLECGLGF